MFSLFIVNYYFSQTIFNFLFLPNSDKMTVFFQKFLEIHHNFELHNYNTVSDDHIYVILYIIFMYYKIKKIKRNLCGANSEKSTSTENR